MTGTANQQWAGLSAIRSHASQDMRRLRKSISKVWSAERFAQKWALFIQNEFDSDEEAARFFNTSDRTIRNWTKQHGTPSGDAVALAVSIGFLDGDYRV